MDAVLAWLRPEADPVFVLLPIDVNTTRLARVAIAAHRNAANVRPGRSPRPAIAAARVDVGALAQFECAACRMPASATSTVIRVGFDARSR